MARYVSLGADLSQIGEETFVLSQNTASETVSVDTPAAFAGLFGARYFEWLDPTKQRALTALVIRVLGAALAYLMQILLAQWMGLAEYGVFVGVWVWLLVLGGIAPLGLNISSIGMLSRFHDRGELDQWRGLLLTSVGATMVAGLIIAMFGWSVLLLSPGLVNSQYLMPVWLCFFCVPLLALSEMNEGIARAHGWMNTALMPTYLARPVLLVGGVFATLQFGQTLDATLVMSVAIFASLVTILIQGTVLIIRLRRIGGSGHVVATPRLWILASLPIVMAQTFELITQNFDMIAVSFFLGPESTGIYFAALKTIGLLAFVNFAIGAATANRIASLSTRGDRQAFVSALNGAINLAFWPTLLGACVLVAAAPFLLSFFGEDFAAHAYLATILALGFVAKSVVGPAELYLNVLGHQKICALVLLVAAAVNMALNIALLPLLGLMGAAIATTISLVVLAVSLFVIAHQRLGVLLLPSLPMTSIRKLFRLVRP